jgi:hypothetical protein
MKITPILLLIACGSPPTPEPRARDARSPAPIATTDATAVVETTREPDTRQWFAGDIHMHVAPPDDPNDVKLGVAGVAERARNAKLDFVVLTPHVWPARRGAQFDKQWREMAKAARETAAPTLIPGVEWTTPSGHFTIAGVDFTALGTDLLTSAHAFGAFISVNHPFAVPSKIPLAVAHYDMSYRAWTANGKAEPIDGVEVWNLPLALANVISKPGGRTGEEHAWLAADRVARTEHRKITAVGGTDNHALNVIATTWVLATSASEAAILDALRAGATCVGGAEAGTLRAKGDADWVRIGGVVSAVQTVTLAWDGMARLFVDGQDLGEHRSGFVHAANGLAHTYRIVVGSSRSGFIYANL